MTSKESFENYYAILNEKNPIDEEAKAKWKTATEAEKKDICNRSWKWKEDHEKRVNKAIDNLIPEVGLPCTIVYYSDQRAATVSRIINDKTIAVKYNKVNCIDYFAGEYEILPDVKEWHGEDIFTKRKNGLWCMKGQQTEDGVLLMLHYQRHYIDPHF